MRHSIAASAIALLAMYGVAHAQTSSQTPKVDNRGPGMAASDVAPGAPSTGVSKDGHRKSGSGTASNQGASAAQTYDYPASAPKTAPAKRP